MRDLSSLAQCSVNTATLGFQAPIAEVIEAVAQAGFGGIAPWRREVEGHDARAIGKHIRQAGLKVSGYCRSPYIPAATRDAFLGHVALNRRAISDAALLGAPVFVMVVGSMPEGSKDIAGARTQVHDGIGLLMDHAKSEGITLGLEPLHPVYAADRSCITLASEAFAMCETLEPDGKDVLGVVLDVYHIWWDPNLRAAIEAAGKTRRISGFHVCDWLIPTTDVLNDRGMMGDGIIDVPDIRRLVEDAGYTGFVEAEIFSARNWWKKPMTETLGVLKERFQSAV